MGSIVVDSSQESTYRLYQVDDRDQIHEALGHADRRDSRTPDLVGAAQDYRIQQRRVDRVVDGGCAGAWLGSMACNPIVCIKRWPR